MTRRIGYARRRSMTGLQMDTESTGVNQPEAKKHSGRKGKPMSELLFIVLFLVGWYLLNAVVLPRLGVST